MYDDEVDVHVQPKKICVEAKHEMLSKQGMLKQPLSLRQLP
jgi:hypothetical protein